MSEFAENFFKTHNNDNFNFILKANKGKEEECILIHVSVTQLLFQLNNETIPHQLSYNRVD